MNTPAMTAAQLADADAAVDGAIARHALDIAAKLAMAGGEYVRHPARDCFVVLDGKGGVEVFHRALAPFLFGGLDDTAVAERLIDDLLTPPPDGAVWIVVTGDHGITHTTRAITELARVFEEMTR